ARCLNNRGNSLTYLGRLAEALTDHDQAVAIYTKLVECLHRRLDLAADLARSLNDRGTARRDDGQLRAAIADHEQAIDILTRLIEDEGQKSDLISGG
ncbi:MAG: tetratricopeptide repeat protein, partial [Isosphaeraceae bacterium]